MSKLIFLCVCLFLLVGCGISESAQSLDIIRYDKADSTVISLKQGQAYVLPNTGIRILFDQVLEDSRCPEGVNCVWAGVGIVQLEVVSKLAKRSVETLATATNLNMGPKQSTLFDGHRIRLGSLDPSPKANRNGSKNADQPALNSIV